MVLTMVNLPKEPCAELLLWGLSQQHYTRIRNWILDQPEDGDETAPSWTQFAERLNARRTRADERHLWIWIDFSLGPPQIPDPLGRLPSTLPAMATGTTGEGIDIVWVAIAKSPNPAIFKCDGHAWEVVDLPEFARQIVTDAIERSGRWAVQQGR